MQQHDSSFDPAAAACELLSSGWRQASVLECPDGFQPPAYLAFKPGEEFLLVCTQSCGVVSPRFDVDPYVEVMAVRKLDSLAARSPEATGKNVRKFHLPVSGPSSIKALSCDMNRRCFMERWRLVGLRPHALEASKEDARRFAGWLSRYYGRAALPNRLVEVARMPGAPFVVIGEVLQEKVPGTAYAIMEGVEAIYLASDTDDEITDDHPGYKVKAILLCRDESTRDHLDRRLLDLLALYENEIVVNQLAFTFNVELVSRVTVGDMQGYERLADFDHLSGLEEIRAVYSGREA